MKIIALSVGLLWATVATAGPVLDAKTAATVARAALTPVYGTKTIRSEESLIATRHGGSWYVAGTLQCAPNCLGGTAFVEISAKDEAVLRMFHSQ